MRITVLAGGVGGAKFLRGVRTACPSDDLTAIVNTGDDVTMHGLRICPDLDSVMYTLGDGIDAERGWGRADETWRVKDELAAYGAEPTWFGLGDLDIATHLVRTRMLDAGLPAHRRHRGPVRPLAARRASAADDRLSAARRTSWSSVDGARKAIHFEEWWIKHRAALTAHAFVQVGVDDAKPGPDVLEAITEADVVLLAPEQSGRVDRHDPGRAGHPRGREHRAGAGGRALPDRRRRAGARHGRRLPAGDRRRGQRRGRRAALRVPAQPAACWTAG